MNKDQLHIFKDVIDSLNEGKGLMFYVNIPVVVWVNQIYHESLHPVTNEDIEKTKHLVIVLFISNKNCSQ